MTKEPIELPNKETPSEITESSVNHTLNIGWPILLVVLVSVVATTAILNQTHENSTDTIVSTIDLDNGDLKIDWSCYTTYFINLDEAGSLEITEPGTYRLTGSIADGLITINAPDNVVRLILDNVTIKNSSGPAIACYAAEDLVIELVGENTLEDGKSYATTYDEDVNGAIYSKDDLTFQGDGTLNLTANYQDGIVGKDDVKFNSGIYNITAKDDGIRGKDSVYVVDGTFNITAKGDGIKSTNNTTAGKGFVLIENGSLTIAASDDGIHAENRLLIYDGEVNITKSYEGLEAQVVMINGGDVKVYASDDGINANGGSDTTTSQNPMQDYNKNSLIVVNGGNVYINAAGDGIDSNGYVDFAGGTVVVDGPTNNGNGALDSGLSISQSGGTVIAVGASGMAETLGDTSSIYNASIYLSSTQVANTKIEIKNSAGETIISHTSAKTFNHIAVGTPDFKKDETYELYLNGSKYTTFTIESITTTIGNSNQNYQQGPGGNNMVRR